MNNSYYSLLGELFDPETARLLFGDQEILASTTAASFSLNVPGYKPENISVSVDQGVLSVSAKQDRKSFERSYRLPGDIDVDAITAKTEYGVLTISLPRKSKPAAKVIPVTT